MNKISVYLSTLFGIGYLPKAPGTFGTFFAFLIYLILPEFLFAEMMNQLIFLMIIIILSLISVPFIYKAEKILGEDNPAIVIDEFFGYMIAVIFLPKTIFIGIFGFIFFRIFDIFKPEPVNVLQKLPYGWGVLTDDLMAGIYANIAVRILYFFVH